MELLERILDNKNLFMAYEKVYGNKGAPGVDGMTADELGVYLYKHKEEIKEQIRNRKYKPLPVLRVEIPKENGDMRKLGIPTVVDRTIQQAIAQILSPIYETQFSETSYGFRPKRSCEMAIIKLLEYINDGYTWIVDIDLEKFFDTVCHDKIITIISKTVHDGDLISLIRKYLVSGVMENGLVSTTEIGTPQGGNLSPLLSNIMLNELDKELERRGLKYTRYADDTIIVVKSKTSARRVMTSITNYIEKKLGLKVNISKSKIVKPTEVKYLGFGFRKSKKGYEPIPHGKSIKKFEYKLKCLTIRSKNIPLDRRIKGINYVIRGWVNYFRIAEMESIIYLITCHLRRRIRCIIWKQWKTFHNRVKCLKQLGVHEIKARQAAGCNKSYWRAAAQPTVHQAITNKILEQKGLIMPDKYYQEHRKIILT